MRTLEKPSADLLADGLVPKGCQQQKKAKNSKTTTNNIKHEEFSAINLIFINNNNNNNDLSNLLHMDQTWSPIESSLTDVDVGNVPPKNGGGNICRKSSGSAVTWFSFSLRCQTQQILIWWPTINHISSVSPEHAHSEALTAKSAARWLGGRPS